MFTFLEGNTTFTMTMEQARRVAAGCRYANSTVHGMLRFAKFYRPDNSWFLVACTSYDRLNDLIAAI